MIKIKKLSEDLKINHPNMDYQITLNGRKQYFTEKDIIELRTKLNLLTIPVVVGQSEQLPNKYCPQSGEPIAQKHKFWCKERS